MNSKKWGQRRLFKSYRRLCKFINPKRRKSKLVIEYKELITSILKG